MKLFASLAAILLLKMVDAEFHRGPKSGPEKKINSTKLTKFPRCWHVPQKTLDQGPRGTFEGYGFLVPHSDSQIFEQLVRQGKAIDQKGGEIFEPKGKKSTGFIAFIKKFLRKFRTRVSSTEDPGEMLTFPSTTVRSGPIEVILPVSGPFLNTSSTKIPDDLEGSTQTVYQSSNDTEEIFRKAPPIYEGKHVTFDLEIKAIPIHPEE